MFDKLGIGGVVGLLLLLAGILLVAWENLRIAAGIALLLAGLGLVVRALVTGVMRQFGMM
jgi:membrane-bound ClpP family serine protease